MSVLLADAQKLTQDKLVAMVINEFRKDQLLEKIPFDNCVAVNGGSTLAYVYNRVTTLATAASRALNAEYVPQEAVTTPITAHLKVFGGSFSVDRVIAQNVKGVTNQVTFQLMAKIEATKALFADQFINGDSAQNALAFDGLDKAVTGSTTELVPAAPIDLTTSAQIDANFKAFMDSLDKWLATLDGKPDLLAVNRYMMAVINAVARRSQLFDANGKDAFGQPVTSYAGVPFYTCGDKPGTSNPIIPISTATSQAFGKTSIYAMRLALDGVHAVSPEGNNIVNTYLPDMNIPGAVKTGEVEMVACMALKATRAAGALRDIALLPKS